jgi:pimeloyl-ACP methyl ester carboxylesterase
VQALRDAGYHALALDLPGFGGSGPPAGYFDRDVEDGVNCLRRRAPGLPLHIWGVSSGGYWAHLFLSRSGGVAGAFFEDVSAHLFDWSWRTAPWGAPAYLFFRFAFRATHRFLDIRRHAAALRVGAAAYVSGDRDPGIRAEETEELARLAGGRSLIVPGAGHLAAIRAAHREVVALALDTFRSAEAAVAPGGESAAPEADRCACAGR